MASTVTIKLYVKDESTEVIKRFVVNAGLDGDESQSLDYFINRVKESGIDVTKYDWQYKDEENDTVTFSSQQEFDVALSQAVTENNDKILRLYFVKKDLTKKKESEITRKQENIRKKIRAVVALRLIVLAISLMFLAFTLLYTFHTHDYHYHEVEHVKVPAVEHVHKPQIDTPQTHFHEWVRQVHEAHEREQLLIQERQARLRDQIARENRERQERLRQEHERRQIALKQEQERRRLIMERERQEQERMRREFHERQEQERKRLMEERERQIRERAERERQERERIEKEKIERAKKEREIREKQENEKKFQERYEYLNQVLEQLGYTNKEMNLALLRTHEGDLMMVLNALQLFH